MPWKKVSVMDERLRFVAREHLQTMRLGDDPRELKKEQETLRITLQKICDDYVARPGKLKPSSRAAIERHVADDLHKVEGQADRFNHRGDVQNALSRDVDQGASWKERSPRPSEPSLRGFERSHQLSESAAQTR